MFPSDSIQLDDERFRQNWLHFMRSPEAARVRQELSPSVSACLAWWLILLVAGLILLVTIRWTLIGLQMLYAFITCAPFRALKENPLRQPDEFQPLLAHGIIVGPDQKHALVLATFEPSSDVSHERNASIAQELAELYTTGGDEDSDPETLALLRDDEYRVYRRRPVPASHNYGFKLLLLDVEIDLAECIQSPEETLLLALVARKGDSGPLAQLPWSVAATAVRLA